MSLPKVVEGSRHTALLITWKQADGTTKVLTGSTLTGHLEDVNGVSRAIDGVLTLADGSVGTFYWAFGALDTGTVGTFKCWFVATYAADGFVDKSYPEDFVVVDAP